ncbi:MAG: dihydropteroate synthase [Marmoricola sp.]
MRQSAVRKARVQVAQGAHLIDIGAESSRASAARVGVS